MNSITYLLSLIQFLYQQNCWLITFICKYIPLKQWAFDDSHSPKYQKFRTDELPMLQFHQNDWDWQLLIPYFEYKYHKKIRPVARRKECDISPDCTCPSCHAHQPFLYRNNGSKGQLKCKVCDTNFSTDDNRFSKHYTLRCPHCGHALVHKRTGNTSSSTNASTRNVPTISITSKTSIKNTWRKTMAKMNTSFTASTANSR